MTDELFYTFVPSDGTIDSLGDDTTKSFPPLFQVGGKALSLIQATFMKSPVPRGFALTVEFFAPWVAVLKQQSQWKKFATSSTTVQQQNDITREDCDAMKEICRQRFLNASNQNKDMEKIFQTAIDQVSGSSDSRLLRSAFQGVGRILCFHARSTRGTIQIANAATRKERL